MEIPSPTVPGMKLRSNGYWKGMSGKCLQLGIDPECITSNIDDILADEEIQIVVELLGRHPTGSGLYSAGYA
jgi:hypothetical protein